MRNITVDVVKKMSFTKLFKLNPFPGKYPTRVLIVQRDKWDKTLGQPRPLREFENLKVVYLGKPNPITLKKLEARFNAQTMCYEFDKQNLVYASTVLGLQIIQRWTPGFEFYHAYVRLDETHVWPWFVTKWSSLRIEGKVAYNHFPNGAMNLAAALTTRLQTEKDKNVRI
jgi:hypothetical protein